MMHFFIRPKIHLDVFTSWRDVIEYAPVVNAIKVIPEWWKKLPKAITNFDGFSPMPTMKTCVGMYDYYNRSVAMPLWSELCINVGDNSQINWQFADNKTQVTPHPPVQFDGFLPDNSYYHMKVHSPWKFKTKEDINWVMSNPVYNRTTFSDYTAAQGILNFSKQDSTHLQLFIDVTKPKTYMIPFGSVFLFTPMTDKKVVIHRHLLSTQQFDSMDQKSVRTHFIKRYFAQQKLAKCPYKDKTK